MINSFIIEKNNFLNQNIIAYYHQVYTGYGNPGNPNFINTLKNTFNNEPYKSLIEARDNVTKILINDLPNIAIQNNMDNCLCMAVPRSKAQDTYNVSQLMFKEAIRLSLKNNSTIMDGTNYIIRNKNTFTTHLAKATKNGKIENDGEKPYPGITKDTCTIDYNRIKNRNIILVDDIYTKSINIDEDCIQALLEAGAKKIIFYSIGYTRRI